MRPRGADRSGFCTSCSCTARPEEMLEFVMPFARDGVAAEEPTLLLVRPETAATVLHRVDVHRYLLSCPPLGQPGRPAADLRATETLLAGYAPRHRRCGSQPGAGRARRSTGTSGGASKPWSTSRWPATTRGRCVSMTGARSPTTWSRTSTPPTTSPVRATTTGATTATRTRSSSSRNTGRAAGPGGAGPPSAQLVNPSPAAARAAVDGFARQTRLPARRSRACACRPAKR